MRGEKAAYLESALAAARAAGGIIRTRFGRPVHTEYKGPSDPVTEVDRQCEALIRDLLKEAHPEVDFWGEESGRRRESGPTTWLVDPLDGTKNFVHGYPFVAVSIALVHQDEVQLGVVYDPFRDELFHAIQGAGAFCNERRLEVSRAGRLEEALVVTGFTTHPPRQRDLIWAACHHCQGLRRGGATALDLCQLAAGRLEALWDWHVRPWDVAAAVLLIREAQGTVSQIDGRPFHLLDDQILASNSSLHRAMVDLLQTGQ